jgi:methionyl-tRNA formyltransferase
MKKSIIVAGYRSWAIDFFDKIKNDNLDINFYFCENQSQLKDLVRIDSCLFVILAGWSWIIPSELIDEKIFFGLHPSDLPAYAGGSPIQNQIIEGINNTKMTLFKLNKKIDKGEIVYKEKINLHGDMDDIFKELTRSSIVLTNKLIKNYPNILYEKQDHLKKNHKRIKPEKSRLTKSEIVKKTTLQLYNEIRCRTSPYPNVYIEDEMGRIYFEKVRYEESDDNKK